MPLQVDEEWIDDVFIEEEARRFEIDYKNRGLAVPTGEDLYRFVRENIARRIVLRREAEKKQIACSDQEIDKMLSGWHAPNDFSHELAGDKERLRSYVRSRIMVDKMLDAVGRDHHPIQQRHINHFYQDNLSYYDEKNFFFFDEITFFYPDQSKKNAITMADVKIVAQTFHKNFTQWLGALDHKVFLKEDDLLEDMRKKIKNDCGDFIAHGFSLEHKALGWLDETVLESTLNNFCFGVKDQLWFFSSPIEFTKGLLFYLQTKKIKGKQLSQQDMFLVLQRDLQKELQENNVELFIQKLLRQSKVVFHKDF